MAQIMINPTRYFPTNYTILQCLSRNESEMKSHLRVYHAGDNAKNKAVMCPHCKKSFTERNIDKHWAVCYERAQGRSAH